jgi:hypothetical protein
MVIKLVQDDSGTRMSATITDLTIDGLKMVKTSTGSTSPVIWPND